MDVASVVCHGCAGRADAILLLLLLLLTTMVITPAKWIKLVDDVLVEDCNSNPCGDGLE